MSSHTVEQSTVIRSDAMTGEIVPPAPVTGCRTAWVSCWATSVASSLAAAWGECCSGRALLPDVHPGTAVFGDGGVRAGRLVGRVLTIRDHAEIPAVLGEHHGVSPNLAPLLQYSLPTRR